MKLQGIVAEGEEDLASVNVLPDQPWLDLVRELCAKRALEVSKLHDAYGRRR